METVPEQQERATSSLHTISLFGVAGLMLWLLLGGVLIYMIAFFTIGWQKITHNEDIIEINIGLWKSCFCQPNTEHQYSQYSWFKASQAFLTMALILLLVALLLILLYLFARQLNPNTVLIAFTTMVFVAFLFLLIGISVFGAKTSIPEFGSGGLNYSFGLAVIALLVTVAVCVLTVLQLRFSRML